MAQDDRPPGFYVWCRDFVADDDFAAMTHEERGIYWTMLLYAWVNDGIPEDPGRIANLVGGGATRESIERADIVLAKFQSHGKGRIHHKRLLAEARRQQSFREKQRNNARSGARKRAESRSQETEDYQDVASRGTATAAVWHEPDASQNEPIPTHTPTQRGNSNVDVVGTPPPPVGPSPWKPTKAERELLSAEGIPPDRHELVLKRFQVYLDARAVPESKRSTAWVNWLTREARTERELAGSSRDSKRTPAWVDLGYDSLEDFEAHTNALSEYQSNVRLAAAGQGVDAGEPPLDPRQRKEAQRA